MKTKEDPPRPEAPRDRAGEAAGGPPAPPAPPTQRERSTEDEEMGGEAPCQLHRFWDGEEAE